MKRYMVIVEGRVQGVGFRAFCMVKATALGLTGSVSNLSNGMVRIFVQGEEALIHKFLSEVKQGDRFIRVDDMSIKQLPVEPKETKFRYDYSEGGWY